MSTDSVGIFITRTLSQKSHFPETSAGAAILRTTYLLTAGYPRAVPLELHFFSICVKDLPAVYKRCPTKCCVENIKLLLSYLVVDRRQRIR